MVGDDTMMPMAAAVTTGAPDAADGTASVAASIVTRASVKARLMRNPRHNVDTPESYGNHDANATHTVTASTSLRSLADLRRFVVSRSLFPPTTLERAMEILGFVQADPIRAPARAQDLILRPRVDGYRAGDLDRQYVHLPIEEDVFINYGFVTRGVQALMHPRSSSLWPSPRNARANALLAFVRARGEVHPREVDVHFSHGRVTNYWGGASSATTQLLEALHYRGLLRVTRREGGVRVYGVHTHGPGPIAAAARRTRVDALADVAIRKYAPLPAANLSFVLRRLQYAAPQWRRELPDAIARAKARCARAHLDGVDWYWPAGEVPWSFPVPSGVRLLAPFDPVVWDRRRFELLWGWAYRFEAYTPAPKRLLGYYALPLLWRDRVVGWGNLSMKAGTLEIQIGYVDGRPPREGGFARELEAEIERMRSFLAAEP